MNAPSFQSAPARIETSAPIHVHPSAALSVKDLGPSARLVLRCLLTYDKRGDGVVWPGHDRIATEVALCRSTVRRALAELELSGYLGVVHVGAGQALPSGKRAIGPRNVYSLRTERLMHGRVAREVLSGERCQVCRRTLDLSSSVPLIGGRKMCASHRAPYPVESVPEPPRAAHLEPHVMSTLEAQVPETTSAPSGPQITEEKELPDTYKRAREARASEVCVGSDARGGGDRDELRESGTFKTARQGAPIPSCEIAQGDDLGPVLEHYVEKCLVPVMGKGARAAQLRPDPSVRRAMAARLGEGFTLRELMLACSAAGASTWSRALPVARLGAAGVFGKQFQFWVAEGQKAERETRARRQARQEDLALATYLRAPPPALAPPPPEILRAPEVAPWLQEVFTRKAEP